MMLSPQKEAFYLTDEVSYFNHAYMSPALRTVQEAGLKGMAQQRLPYLMDTGDLFFKPADQLRALFNTLLNGQDPNRIVITPSTSYALANVAKNLKISAGEKIVLIHEQFPSNVYPWKRIAKEKQVLLEMVAAPKTTTARGQAWNAAILESITPNTRLVSMSQVHWADGTLFDLKAIRKRTREVGALLVIDGTQSVGALPFDLAEIDPDMLVCAGYKWLMGPYSIGLAYYGKYFDDGIPIEESWMNRLGSNEFRALADYEERYLPGALRYEVGEHSHFIQLPMLLQSLEQIRQWGIANIQAYCKQVNGAALTQLQEWGYIIEDENYRGSHLVGVRTPPQVSLDKLRELFDQNKIKISMRGNSIRISFHTYILESDIDKLLATFKAVL